MDYFSVSYIVTILFIRLACTFVKKWSTANSVVKSFIESIITLLSTISAWRDSNNLSASRWVSTLRSFCHLCPFIKAIQFLKAFVKDDHQLPAHKALIIIYVRQNQILTGNHTHRTLHLTEIIMEVFNTIQFIQNKRKLFGVMSYGLINCRHKIPMLRVR